MNVLEEQKNRSLQGNLMSIKTSKKCTGGHILKYFSATYKNTVLAQKDVFYSLIWQNILNLSEEDGEESHTAAIQGVSASVCSYGFIFFLVSLAYTVVNLKTSQICFYVS